MGKGCKPVKERVKACRDMKAAQEKLAADKAAERKKMKAISMQSARALAKAVPVRSRTHACVYF